MKIFIYKLLISLLFFYIFFEITIGSRINYFTDKIDFFTDHESRIQLKEKIKSELKKGIDKDNYFSEEEKILISTFINKLKEELSAENNQ